MKFKAIVHVAEEGGFWAKVPALFGCFTQGESIADLEVNIHEAIEGRLEPRSKKIRCKLNHSVI
jgi:predicted RNase H-like HicB family nuclease